MLDIEYLRKTVGVTIADFDSDLNELEAAAITKLKLSGICESKIIKTDNLIVQTIRAYVKAGYRNTDKEIAERYKYIFEENKNFMRSTREYTEEQEVEA